MMTGLIFVRIMPVNEYALYAMAIMALNFATVGSDLGLNGSLSYFWRQSLAERLPVERKIAAVRKLRSLLFVCSLTIGVIIFLTSNLARSSSVPILVVMIIIIAITAWLQLHCGIGLTLLRLCGLQRQSYNCEISGNLARFGGTIVMAFSGLVTAWLALAVGLAGAVVMTLTLGIYGKRETHLMRSRTQIFAQDWHELRCYLLPVLPAVLVYMIQDPIVYWFTAQRAGATSVAEFFALSRIGAIVALLGTFVYIVLTPRLSSIAEPARFLRTLTSYFFGLAILAACPVIFVAIVPEVPLWLIGQKYSHLQSELLVSISAIALSIPTALIVLSNRIRGWVALDPIMACLQLSIIVGLCLVWDFSSTLNVVTLSLALATTASISATLIFLTGILRPSMVLAKSRKGSEKNSGAGRLF